MNLFSGSDMKNNFLAQSIRPRARLIWAIKLGFPGQKDKQNDKCIEIDRNRYTACETWDHFSIARCRQTLKLKWGF